MQIHCCDGSMLCGIDQYHWCLLCPTWGNSCPAFVRGNPSDDDEPGKNSEVSNKILVGVERIVCRHRETDWG